MDTEIHDMMLTGAEYAIATTAIATYRMWTEQGFVKDAMECYPWDAGTLIEEALREGRHAIENDIQMDRVLRSHADELDNTYGE